MPRIRPARLDDAASLVEFQLRLARETEDLELDPDTVSRGVAAVLNDPARGAYWVAEMDGKVIASLLATTEWSDWRNATIWWIQSLYVMPEHRGQGVFRAMFRHLQGLVRECDDVAGLRLYVATENAAARRAYEALGMDGTRYRMYEWMPEEEHGWGGAGR